MKRIVLFVIIALFTISLTAQNEEKNQVIFEIPTIKVDGIEQYDYTLKSTRNIEFIKKTFPGIKKIHHLSRTNVSYPELSDTYSDGTVETYRPYFPATGAGQFMRTLHDAFRAHTPIVLSPEVAWYLIISEVATCVKQNSKKYAKWFTDDPDKKKVIKVRDDTLVYGSDSNNWQRSIELYRKPLKANVTEEAYEAFMPQLSTLTPEAETAILVTFMDAASEFYDYFTMTACGIPEIQLAGKPEDWSKLVEHSKKLQKMFPTLDLYFKDLIPVLETIEKSAKGQKAPHQFWCSIYKYESGSGEPDVTGWINAFFAYEVDVENKTLTLKSADDFNWKEYYINPDGFSANLSKVNFTWDYHGNIIKMNFIAGIMSTEVVNGKYLKPTLGFGVLEPEDQSK